MMPKRKIASSSSASSSGSKVLKVGNDQIEIIQSEKRKATFEEEAAALDGESEAKVPRPKKTKS